MVEEKNQEQDEEVVNETFELKKGPEKTILIFGISSFVGSNLANFLKTYHKVVGTYNNTPVNIPGILTIPCDVLQKESVQLAIYTARPDITIYCIGVNSVTLCSGHEELADALNTSGLFNVTEMCQRYSSQIMYISNDWVFSGENKKYAEMDIPDAGTVLGKTKASGEFYVQKNSLNYMVFRTCHLYGRHFAPKKRSFFEKLQVALTSPSVSIFDCYVNQGFLDVTYLGMIIKLCIDKKSQNRLIQICSSDIMSYHSFALLYCKIFNESSGQVAKGRWPLPLIRLRDGTEDNWYYQLDTSNLEGFLNIEMPSIEESLILTLQRCKGELGAVRKKKQGGNIAFI